MLPHNPKGRSPQAVYQTPDAHLIPSFYSRRVVSEGVVDKPADLDVATVMSMGFPAYR